MVAPLVRTEGEIGEVVITALGLANPKAFRYSNINITYSTYTLYIIIIVT